MSTYVINLCLRSYVEISVFIESKQTEEIHRGKEISFNRPGFVCFSPSVLPYPHSLYLAKRSSAVSFLFLSLLSFAGPPIFPLLPVSSAREQSLLSYRNLSYTSNIFPETISLLLGRGNRPNADAAGAQRSPDYPRQVRTYLCYICNRKLYPTNEINRSRRLLRNAFDHSCIDRFSLSMISFIK